MSTLLARRPSRSYTPAPEGLWSAVAVDVVDLGLLPTAWGAKPKVRIVWQLDVIDEANNRRFDVARVYTLSLHERSALRKDLESWRGKKFTEAELSDGFDLEKLVGVNAQIAVTQTISDDGRSFANVSSVVPPVKGAPRLVPLAYVRAKDRQRPSTGAAATDLDDPMPF